MFVSRPSFLGKASKEGFSADREGPPVGLATGCGSRLHCGHQPRCRIARGESTNDGDSQMRPRPTVGNSHAPCVVSTLTMHTLHSMHLSGELSGHSLYVCTNEHKCKAYSVHCVHMRTHISHSKARTLHGNESMQLPRRGKNIERHMSSPFDISSSRRVHPSVQTKLSMNGSKTSVRPTQKKLAAHGDNLFSLEVFACPRKSGERREPPARAQCLMAHGVTKRAGKDIEKKKSTPHSLRRTDDVEGRTKATWSLMGKSIPLQIQDSAREILNLIRII